MSLTSLIADLPQALRTTVNKHRYIIFGSRGIRTMATNKKDNETLVASLLGQWGVSSFSGLAQKLVALGLVAGMLSTSGAAWAIPTNANTTVQGGTLTNPNANTANFNGAGNMVANTTDFNTTGAQTVNITHGGSNNYFLGKISGGPTNFFGALNSNGHVFLINPSGIVFGAGSLVNVAGLTASTMPLGMSDADFLNYTGTGNLTFTRGANTPAAINNFGTINTTGDLNIFASRVGNAGTLNAGGQVNLAVGDTVTMVTSGGVLVDVTVDDALSQKVGGLQDAILNNSVITGNMVNLQAELDSSLYDKAINNRGRIEATTVATVDGAIVLKASNSQILNNGTIDSTGTIGITNSGGSIENQNSGVVLPGSITADGDITITTTDDLISNFGTPANRPLIASANGDVSLLAGPETGFNSGTRIINFGDIEANNGNITVRAANSVTNNRGTINGKTVDVTAEREIRNVGGAVIDAQDTLNVTSKTSVVENRFHFTGTNRIGNENLTEANITARNNVYGGANFLAKTLNLTSTNANLGTNAANPLMIDADTVTLNAGNNAFVNDIDDVNLGASNVANMLALASTGAGELNITADVTAGGDINLTNTTDKVINQAGVTIESTNGNITLTANQTPGNTTRVGGQAVDNYGTVRATNGTISTDSAGGTNNYGTASLMDGQNITIQANGRAHNEGTIEATNDVSITSRTRHVTNDGDISGANVAISAERDVTNSASGTIDATNSIDIDATGNGRNVINDGTIGNTALTTADITAKDNITGAGSFLAQTLNLTATDGNIGTDAANPLMIDADTVTLNAGDNAFVSDVDNIALGASSATNALALASTGAGDITVTGDVSGGSVTLTNNNGGITQHSDITATSTDVTQTATGAIVYTGNTIIDANRDVTIAADGQISQHSNETIKAGRNIDISAKGNGIFTATGSAIESTGGNITLTGHNNAAIYNSADITATGDINLTTANAKISNDQKITSTAGNVTLEAGPASGYNFNGSVTQGITGQISAANGTVSITASSSIDNGQVSTDTASISGKTVTLTANKNIFNHFSSSIDATDSLTLTSTDGSIDNWGTIGSTGLTTADITANNNIAGFGNVLAQTVNLTATTGNIGTDAANPLMIDADTVTLNAAGNAFVNDIDDVNLGASNVANMLALASTGAGEVIVTGNTTAKNVAITNNNGNLDVANGVSVTGETVDFTATGETEINTGASVTATNGALNITADSDNDQSGNVFNKGTIQANNGRVTIDARKITNDTAGQILSDADQIHLITGAPWNYSAKIEGNDIVNKGTITAASRLNIQAADDIENTGGTITAQTVDAFAADDIKVDGGSVHGTANVNFITGNSASPENFRDITITDASVTAANRVQLNAGDDITVEGDSTIGNGLIVSITAADNLDIAEDGGNAPTVTGSGLVNIFAGDELATDGTITSSGGNVTLYGVEKLTNDANVTGATVALASEDNITNNGSLTSTFSDINIDSVVGSEESNISNTGTINSAANVTINAGDAATPDANDNITNTGSITAVGDVTLNAGDSVANNGTGSATSTGGIVDIDAANAFTSETDSTITGNQGVDIDANTVDTDGAITATNNDVTIDTVGNLKNDGTITSNSRHVLLTSSTGDVENTGTVEAERLTRLLASNDAKNSGSLSGLHVKMLAFDEITNSAGGTIDATDTVELRSRGNSAVHNEGADIINNGSIDADGAVTITSRDDVNNTGSVQGASVAITAMDDVTNTAPGSITSTTGDITIDALGSTVTNSGVIDSAAHLTINAGDSGIFQEGDDIINTATGELLAAKTITLNAGDDVENAGLIDGKNVDIDAGHRVENDADAKIKAKKNLTIDAKSVGNDGRLIAKQDDVTVNASVGTINNSATGEIIANQGKVTLTADASNIVNQGDINAAKKAKLEATNGSVSNGGSIHGNNVVVRAKEDITNQTGGMIHANNNITIENFGAVAFAEGQDIINNGSIVGYGDVAINGNDDVTVGTPGSVYGNNVAINAADDILVNGSIETGTATPPPIPASEGNITLNAGNNVTVGTNGLVEADNLVDVDAGNNITTNGDVIGSNVDMKATNNIIINGLVDTHHGDILTVTKTTKIPLEGDTVTLDAGNNITIGVDGVVHGAKMVDAKAGNNITVNGAVESGLSDFRFDYSGSGPHLGTVKLDAVNNVTVGADGLILADNTVDMDAGNDITVNGLVSAGVQPDDIFSYGGGGAPRTLGGPVPFGLEGGDIDLNAGNDVTVSATGGVFAGNSITGTAVNNINVDGMVSALSLLPLVAVRTAAAVPPPIAPGSVNLTATNGDITVSEEALVIGQNLVSGNAGNNIQIDGTVFAGEPVLIRRAAGSAPPLFGGDIALNAGNDLTVSMTGIVAAGNDITADTGNNLTVEMGGIMSAGNDLTATAGNDIINDGVIEAGVGLDNNNTGDARLIADNNISGKGITRGDLVRLRAKNGDVGSAAMVLNTEANKLRINANKGSAFVSEADDVILRKSNAQDDLQMTSQNAGDITVTGEQTATDIFIDNKDGNIIVDSTITATNTADVTAENSISGTGTVGGDLVKLKAKNGDIGSDADSLNTEANKLRVTAKNGSAFVDELDDVKLRRGQALGTLKVASLNTGDIDITGEQTGTDIIINNNDGNILVNNTVDGSNSVSMTTTTDGNIDVNAEVTGGSSVDMTAQGAINVNADILGNDDVNLSALDGNLSGPGLVSGEEIVLNASNEIGLSTNASFLTTTSGGTTNLFDSNSVVLRSMVAGGNLLFSNGTDFPGVFDPLGSGSVLAGRLQGNRVFVDVIGNLLDGNGSAVNLVANGGSSLTAGGIIGTLANPFDVNVSNGSLSVGANGQLAGTSIVIDGVVNPSNSLNLLNTPPGAVIFNGGFLALGSLGDSLVRGGLPYLTVDYNRLRDLFDDAVSSVDGVIADGETTSVEARIINEITDFGQPFDLRLIEDEGSDTEDGGFSFVAAEDTPTPSE